MNPDLPGDLTATLLSWSEDGGLSAWPAQDSDASSSWITVDAPALPLALADERLAERYVLRERVGYGGFGEVWRARDQQLDRSCAVKIIRLQPTPGTPLERRFLFEVLASGAVRHPHLVELLDHGRTGDGRLFLVFAYLQGCNLRELLLRQGGQMPAQAAWMGAQMASGLAALHARGVVHCDLKPGNIFLEGPDTPGRVRIVDFGLARLSAHTFRAPLMARRGGVPAGTPGYMSPEQVDYEVPTAASDLYALGCVLHASLTGRSPFSGSVRAVLDAHKHEPVPPLPAPVLATSAGRQLAELVGELMAKAPAARPGSARAVQERLLQIARAGGIAAQIVPPPMSEASASQWFLDGGLHGRRRERALLAAWLRSPERVVVPRFAWVEGAEGVGKTRLGRWFGERAAGLGESRLLHLTAGDSVADSLTTLRELVLSCLSLAAEEQEHALRQIFAGQSLAASYQIAELRRLLDGGVQPAQAADDRGTRRGALLTAVARAVIAACRRSPLIVVADGLESAPPMLVQALRAVVDEACTAGAALTVLLLVRSGTHRESLAGLRRQLVAAEGRGALALQEVALGALEPDACRALLAGAGPMDASLVDRLVGWCGGNPGLLEESLRHLVAGGWLQQREGRWVAVQGWRPPEALDARLDGLLGAEIDLLLRRHGGLDGQPALLLRLLALAGGGCQADILRVAMGLLQGDDAPDFEVTAARLMDAGLVHGRGGHEGLALRHTRLTTLVAALPGGSQPARRLHGALADAMGAISAATRHLWGAGRFESAWAATREQVQHSRAVYDHDSVVGQLEQALAHGAAGLDPDERVTALRQLGEALLSLGRTEDATAVFHRLLDSVDDGDQHATVVAIGHLGLARSAEARMAGDEALAALDAALRSLPEDQPALLGRIELLRGQVLTATGRVGEARMAYGAAVWSSKQAGEPAVAARALVEQAFTQAWSGRLDDAQALLDVPQLHAPDLDPFVVARAAFVQASVHDQRGDLDAAAEAGDRALAMVRQLGHRRAEASTLISMGYRLGRQGDRGRAEAMMLGALHLSEDLGEARLLAACCNNLADHYVGVGRPGDAVPYARRAAQEAISCGARGAAAVALVTVAQACEASGLLPQAVAAARESLQRNGEPPVRPSSRDTAQALLRRLNDLSG